MKDSKTFNTVHTRPARIGLSTSILLVVALACLSVLSVAVASDDLPDAETVLDKYVEVTGGKEAYEKLTNRVTQAKMEFVAQGIELRLTIYQAEPNKNYTLIESEAIGKIEKGTDGEVVWETSVTTGPQIKEGQERTDYLREMKFDKWANWREVYEKAETVGVGTVAERPCNKVVLTPSDGKPQTLYFDQESNLLAQLEFTVETPMGTFPMVSQISDYREVDGILIPHHAKFEIMGQERVMTTESVEHNVDIPPERFELPADVRALLPKGEKEKKASS